MYIYMYICIYKMLLFLGHVLNHMDGDLIVPHNPEANSLLQAPEPRQRQAGAAAIIRIHSLPPI